MLRPRGWFTRMLCVFFAYARLLRNENNIYDIREDVSTNRPCLLLDNCHSWELWESSLLYKLE